MRPLRYSINVTLDGRAADVLIVTVSQGVGVTSKVVLSAPTNSA